MRYGGEDSRMKRLVVVVLVVGLAAAVLCLGSTESLTNHSGKTASGVVLTFSESVRITSYDQTVFPKQDPAGRAETFSFSGGELANGGRFKVTWTPNSEEIVDTEWIAARGETPTKETLAGPDEPYVHDPSFYVGARLSGRHLTTRIWDPEWEWDNPLPVLRQHGFEWAIVSMRTTSSAALRSTSVNQWNTLPWQSEYWCSVEMAEEMLREAADAGFHLCLYLNLSDTETNGGQQHAPAAWVGLSVEETAARVEEYTYTTARHLAELGLKIELYSMSGEIEWGILDFRPAWSATDGRIRLPSTNPDITTNMAYMRKEVWPIEAQLLRAGIAGIRRADPSAQILLYVGCLSLLPNDLPTVSFFEAMVAEGVDFDFAGFSWVYPYAAGLWPFAKMAVSDFLDSVDSICERIAVLGKPIIIAECGYPSSASGVPEAPMPRYPFTPAGQAQWVHDRLRYARNDPRIRGLFYFAPDWPERPYDGADLAHMSSNSLFFADGTEKPALDEFLVNLPQD